MKVYVNDPEQCDSLNAEYVTSITERIIQDEDAVMQKYEEVDILQLLLHRQM